MMVSDEWVRAAMTDDTVVVQLLVRLKQSQTASSSSSLKSSPKAVVPLRWGLRLPRSRPPTMRCDAVSRRKDADSTRCSPTTPLSWSGGASPSATADGFDDSSFHTSVSYAATRSKGTAANESTATKRTRRKKTFAELKEEESSLLKERTNLRKELATLRVTFKEQRVRNESLKRMKLDLGLHSAMILSGTCDGSEKAVSREPYQRVQGTSDDGLQSDSCEADKAASPGGSSFLLPDLNMMPNGEDSGSETLYGMS
ncbi:hypothetical protein FCV25MIE_24463 [Fagus crenata]